MKLSWGTTELKQWSETGSQNLQLGRIPSCELFPLALFYKLSFDSLPILLLFGHSGHSYPKFEKMCISYRFMYLRHKIICVIWDKVFKNGPSKTCGRQTLKN